MAIIAVLAMARMGLDRRGWPDWSAEARPSVDALLAGHLLGFLRSAPAYGGSLLLRAPFMALTHLWAGGDAAVYRAGAAPCLAATAALGLWLRRGMARRGCGQLSQSLAIVLCVANPLTIPALQIGHPEELLGAALCAAAVLCAQRDHAAWSGVLVGLALANKSWGVLAVGPVMVALQRDRGRTLVAMVLTAAAFLAPFVLVRSGGIGAQAAAVGATSRGLFSPWQLWWFFGVHPAGTAATLRVGPGWLGALGHTLPIAIMPPLTIGYALFARRHTDRRRRDALLLLALLLLLRCALDPWDTSYYAVPFLTALLAWETTTRDRPPLLSLAATLAAWFVLERTTLVFGDNRNALALGFAVAAVPATAAMCRHLFGPATNAVSPALTGRRNPSLPTREEAIG